MTGTGREDYWTEPETETLINSWGDRYVQLNRGNLRQKDWRHVADAVNSIRDPIKIPRTDVQCKNRIDTLKKKYKVEMSKTTPSSWPFFTRLGQLIGSGNNITRKKGNGNSKLVVSELLNCKGGFSSKGGFGSGGSSSKGGFGSGGSGDDREGGVGYKEFARAIERFGEVYERMENVKQVEMVKMEKERMEFTREVEFHRLNMFMETRVEIEKMKNKMKKKERSLAAGSGSVSAGKKPQR